MALASTFAARPALANDIYCWAVDAGENYEYRSSASWTLYGARREALKNCYADGWNLCMVSECEECGSELCWRISSVALNDPPPGGTGEAIALGNPQQNASDARESVPWESLPATPAPVHGDSGQAAI
ncbi:MAG TPA: hypothetical protein VL588_12250 [Bdellovibrionota bacterium]|nr:hypothetical protein [Bdellovibrionota bacterium]